MIDAYAAAGLPAPVEAVEPIAAHTLPAPVSSPA
jgi:hypothetical protein